MLHELRRSITQQQPLAEAQSAAGSLLPKLGWLLMPSRRVVDAMVLPAVLSAGRMSYWQREPGSRLVTNR